MNEVSSLSDTKVLETEILFRLNPIIIKPQVNRRVSPVAGVSWSRLRGARNTEEDRTRQQRETHYGGSPAGEPEPP